MDNLKRIPIQFLDKLIYTESVLYELEIHLIMDFDAMIDKQRLHRSLRILMDAEPVLGCRFVDNWRKPYWMRLSVEDLDNAILLEEYGENSYDHEEVTQQFFGKFIDITIGPLIKALLLPRNIGDRVILKISHVICDAGGFKELLYTLASVYRELGDNTQYTVAPRLESRSLYQVYNNFSPLQWIAILWRGLMELCRQMVPYKSHQYPSGHETNEPLRYVFKQFSKDRVEGIVKYAKAHNATINDIFITAIFRAMAMQSGWDNIKTLRLLGTVDLRRYIQKRETKALCQSTGFYVVNLGKYLGDSFDNTLNSVKDEMNYLKKRYFGLGSLFLLRLIYAPYPFFLFKKMARNQWQQQLSNGNMPPLMSNLGPIKCDASNFGSITLKSAQMTIPASRPPWFACGLSGYDSTLTLSAGIYPSAIPLEQVEELFGMIDAELPMK